MSPKAKDGRPVLVTTSHRAWNGSAKLTAQEVLDIRQHLERGRSVFYLADDYGVSPACIRFIQWRRTWRHL